MLANLEAGHFGVHLRLPGDWAIQRDGEQDAELHDARSGVHAYLFYFRGQHLDLQVQHRDDLRAALERHARHMFDELFAQTHDAAAVARTADASWSPLVDVEHFVCDGVPALRTVHRMQYQRGREMVMGHLLIPLRDGLFEVRVVAADTTTGFRESAMLLTRNAPGGTQFLTQAEYDDPANDELFPHHSLSRVRAALRTFCIGGDLRVLAKPATPTTGEVILRRLGAALVPPPRFVHIQSDHRLRETFARVSFCGTDGVETFLVERIDRRAGNLRQTCEELTRQVHIDAGVQDIELQVEEVGPQVLIIVDGQGHQGRLRNAMRWFTDGKGRLWLLTIISSAAVPRAVLGSELDSAARSWRPIASGWRALFQ
jgi:hypothetical protein